MQILVISGSASASGGAEKVALTSARRLAGRGHQVTAAAAYGPIDPQFMGVPGLTVVTAHPEARPARPGFAERVKMVWPDAVGQFVSELCKSLDPSDSLIHFHNGYFEFSVPGFRALANSGLPIVYTHHDYGWACPLTGFFDYTRKDHCPLQGGSLKCLTTDCTNSSVEKLIRFSRHYGTHQSSGIGKAVKEHIFISQTAREKLSPYLGAGSSSSFLANPTEFDCEGRVPVNSASELVFVGRLTFEKDPLALAEATRVAQMTANFIGDGDLRSQLAELVCESRVKGWKTPSETAAFIRGSRGLVLPSRWLEVAPLVIFEAAALGVPVVAPSDTAAAEFVDHGKTGLIYDRKEKCGLTNAISQLKDDGYADNLGMESYRRFWLDPPTWAKHLNGLEAIYQRVISKRDL